MISMLTNLDRITSHAEDTDIMSIGDILAVHPVFTEVSHACSSKIEEALENYWQPVIRGPFL